MKKPMLSTDIFNIESDTANIILGKVADAVIIQTMGEGCEMRAMRILYNAEQDCVFQGGKEFRWADLRSFRFLSDRIQSIDKTKETPEVYIKTDAARNRLNYLYFRDQNGWNEISSTESVNPWWQSDYALVHFTFVPPNNQPFAGKFVYLMGELTGNQVGDTSRMEYEAPNGIYTKTLYLKQGYYSYTYITKDNRINNNLKTDYTLTEGSFWETENEYSILFYFRSFSSRHDELLGMATVNSKTDRPGY